MFTYSLNISRRSLILVYTFSLFYPIAGLHFKTDQTYFVTRSSKKFFLKNNSTNSHAREEKSAFDLTSKHCCLLGSAFKG